MAGYQSHVILRTDPLSVMSLPSMSLGKPIEQVVRTGRAYCFNCEEFTQHDHTRWLDRRDEFGTFEKRLECTECEAQHLNEYHPQEKDDTPLFYDMEEKYRTDANS